MGSQSQPANSAGFFFPRVEGAENPVISGGLARSAFRAFADPGFGARGISVYSANLWAVWGAQTETRRRMPMDLAEIFLSQAKETISGQSCEKPSRPGSYANRWLG